MPENSTLSMNIWTYTYTHVRSVFAKCRLTFTFMQDNLVKPVTV